MELKQVDNIIQRLKGNSISRNEREGFWRLLLMDYPFWHQNVDIKNDDDQDGRRKFFRVQKGLHNTAERMFPLVSGDERIGLGRANYEEESLLYCTDIDFYSCLLELVERTHQDLQTITVIEFANKVDLTVIPIGLTDRQRYTELLKANGVKFTEEEFRKYLLISEFMDDEFRLITEIEGRSYLNSSVISKVIRDEFPKANGIRYRTVRGFNFFHRGLNYALNIDNFDDYFEVTNCMQQEFQWLEDEQYQFKQLAINVGKVNNTGIMEFEKYK